jgi:hypothetical protein
MVICALFLIAALKVSAGAQDLLPPGPGWAVSGSSVLVDRISVTDGVQRELSQACGGFEWWLALSNPYSVKGLSFTGAYLSLPVKSGAIGAGLKQLQGDGLTHCEAEVSCRQITILDRPVLCLSAAAGYQIVNGTGTRRLAAGYCRFGIAAGSADGWRMAFLLNRAAADRDNWIKQWTGFAMAWQAGKYALRAGCLQTESEQLEPALSLACYLNRLRIDVGAWGAPPLPAAGLHMNVGGVCWSVEGRWVPALGLNLLWSISSPQIWEK